MRLLKIAAFAVLPFTCLGQDILWEKSLGGKHAEYLFDAQPTADYGFILAGSSISEKTGNKTDAGRGNFDYWIWKMDEKGDQLWQKSFGGSGSDLLQCIRLTNDGGFLLAGTSNSPKGNDKHDEGYGENDFWIIKLDAAGGVQWQKTIGGNGQDVLKTAIQTSDGGYLLGGSSSSEKSGDKTELSRGGMDYWLVKLDCKGNLEWQKTYGGSSFDDLRDLVQTYDGGFLVGGYSNSPYSGEKNSKIYGSGDFWILLLDDRGGIRWQRTFGGDGDDQLNCIIKTSDGNFLLGGSSNSGPSNNMTKSVSKGTDFWVIKLSADGELLWQETYDVGAGDILTSIIENEDRTIVLAGHSKSESAGRKKDDKGISDYIVLKVSEKGEEIWRKAVGSNGEDVLRKMIETRDGGYLMAGTSNGTSSRDRKTGVGRSDFWVVKLKDKEKREPKPKPVEAFPNPTDVYTNIIIGFEYGKGRAMVFDIAGHQLQRFEIDGRTIPINLSGLPEGIYIVQVVTDKGTDSVKVIKGMPKN